MFKFYRSVLAAGVVALGLAACGDNVTVTNPPGTTPVVHSVSVVPVSQTVSVGQSGVTFVASVVADSGKASTVTWTSTNPTVATVNATSGLIVALAPGQATIVAKSTADNTKTGAGSLTVVALYLIVVRVFNGRPTIWEAMLVPLMIASTMLRPRSLAGRLLESPVMRWLGRLSYSLYLWELFFVFRGVPQTLGILQTFPLDVVLTVACASASYYFVERPLIRVGHRLTPRIPASAQPVASPAAGTRSIRIA